MRILDRIAKLEARLTEQFRSKRRGVPEWLQSDLESEGWIFEASGHLVSAPDPLRQSSPPIRGRRVAPANPSSSLWRPPDLTG
jgi:hypothetical protein